ncbi:hypothetical protein Cgig2_007902 [Carnegiea gigantea]|uniref:Uncharacterized protein n=1 Tax=Carnegiea gigantea TaxID=171969 RepID=A0A9Q1QHK6_9CARY|nr:hypothetical protein Cgig2_007902 [Carnegiea gigantea]
MAHHHRHRHRHHHHHNQNRHHHHHNQNPTSNILPTTTALLLLSVLCFSTLLLTFYLFKSSLTSSSRPTDSQFEPTKTSQRCNFTHWKWVYDPSPRSTVYRAFTIAYHRTILLAQYGRWWAPSKFDPVNSPMLFFKNGVPILPPTTPDVGLDMVLKHMVNLKFDARTATAKTYDDVTFVESKMQPGGIRILRIQSPGYFEGELFAMENNRTNVAMLLVNHHLNKALKEFERNPTGELRADAHPSTAGGKKHQDCIHWCRNQ